MGDKYMGENYMGERSGEIGVDGMLAFVPLFSGIYIYNYIYLYIYIRPFFLLSKWLKTIILQKHLCQRCARNTVKR